MRSRKEILKELILLQGNIAVLEKELSQYPWDIEEPLFKISIKDFTTVLKRSVDDETDLKH